MNMHGYLRDPSIDIATLGMVDDDTRPRILRVVRDVIVHEDDDVLVLEPAPLHDLVGMADIRLVAVVVVAVGAGDEDGPPGALGGLGSVVRRRASRHGALRRQAEVAALLLPPRPRHRDGGEVREEEQRRERGQDEAEASARRHGFAASRGAALFRAEEERRIGSFASLGGFTGN